MLLGQVRLTPAAVPLAVICGQVTNLPATTLPLKLEHGWFEAMALQRFAKEEIVLRPPA